MTFLTFGLPIAQSALQSELNPNGEQLMKYKNSKVRIKGSVLIAVIGFLAVLSAMALRFNAEMEIAMIKTTGKNISSDVKIVANSGLQYCIAGLLKNGKSCTLGSSVTGDYEHAQLAIEEELELRIKNNDPNAALDSKREYIGSGVPYFGAERFNAMRFYGSNISSNPSIYIPENQSLPPSGISFLVEDLSGKLPIGHVSQWFQRHLISATLCKLIQTSVPILSGLKPANVSHYKFEESIAELFEETIDVQNGFDRREGKYVYLRSLIPYELASKTGLNKAHLNTAGLPLADGILAMEELGSSYSWAKYLGKESEKLHATDMARTRNDYLLLEGALTPFSRFIHETKFTDRSTYPAQATEVSYASINPMVMYHQNERLYYSLFNYEPVDPQLRMYFSVSCDPRPKDLGVYATDGNRDQVAAIADRNFFENNTDGNTLTTVTSITIQATSNTLVYNARDDESDLHPLPPIPFSAKGVEPEKKIRWGDAEFLTAPEIDSVYYVAMAKAIKRMQRAFKGTMVHELPAENIMCPIMTRKALEFAIINCVFGDSILFVVDHRLVGDGGIVDYLRLFKALNDGKIDLSKIKFVENAFAKFIEPNMAEKYFVPYWEHYDENLKSSEKYLPPDLVAKDIKIPSFGLYFDGKDYINYLPHPQTDQRGLHQVFVSVAAAFSVEKKKEVNENSEGSSLDIRKLYDGAILPGCKAVRDMTDAYDAYIDLSTPQPYTIGEEKNLPEDNFIKLFNVNVLPINFKPANFSPYETKIRMAVLVNLLNAIIPAKISPSKNIPDPNKTLFSSASNAMPLNLKDFIYFKDGQYWVSNDSDGSSAFGLPKYLNGWTGGIRTPGMTFWKYGVHSTTFQCTVDAFKYEDAARLSTVITFDLYDDKFDGEKEYSAKIPETTNKHAQPNYELTEAGRSDPDVYSTIYLYPKGRAVKKADNFVIGNGRMRYPTDTNTDSWRILSSVWSQPFARTNEIFEKHFTTINLFPEDVLNQGADGGCWHFEPHSNTDSFAFDRFFVDSTGKSSLYYSAPTSKFTYDFDFSTGKPLQRRYSFGKNSWLQWKARFTKKITSSTMEIMVTRNPGTGASNYTMEHQLTATNSKNGELAFTYKFSTSSSSISPMITSAVLNLKKPDGQFLEIPEGEYDIRLTELKDSDPMPNQAEKITKITFRFKPVETGFYTH